VWWDRLFVAALRLNLEMKKRFKTQPIVQVVTITDRVSTVGNAIAYVRPFPL